MTQVLAAAVSDRGKLRGNNEDNFFVNGRYLPPDKGMREHVSQTRCGDQAQLYAVCDGIGGESYGELFSYLAVSGLEKCREELGAHRGVEAISVLERHISKANRLICEKNREHREKNGGTTIALLCLRDGSAYSCNLGDSRCYFIREGVVRQISTDHTVLQRMRDKGFKYYEKKQMRRDSHTLTQYLGIPPEELVLEPYLNEAIRLHKGDVFLLCSDGLTDMVSVSETGPVIFGEDSCDRICENLLNLALNAGGRDNVTIVAVKILEV